MVMFTPSITIYAILSNEIKCQKVYPKMKIKVKKENKSNSTAKAMPIETNLLWTSTVSALFFIANA